MLTVDKKTIRDLPITYLVNQYPQTSVGFIRREIAGLEKIGCQVHRVSIRRWSQQLCDENDIQEGKKTEVLLDYSWITICRIALLLLIRRPVKFIKTLRLALRIGNNSDRGILRHIVYFMEACLLEKITRRTKSSWVHSHFGTNSTTVAMLCNSLGGPRYSFTAHGPEEFDRPERLSLREKITRAGFVVAVSEFGRSQLYRWSEYSDWKKIYVVHCGVDEPFLLTKTSPCTNSHLVCVARIHEQKGIPILINAAAKLLHEGINFELTLVGDGPLRDEMQELIVRLGIAEQVRLTGWMSSQQVKEAIFNSRALVLPSFAEGLPVVLMEALALGRPVVTTAVAGIPELVVDGENGWVVPPGSVEQFAQALREVLAANENHLASLGENGAEQVRDHHDATKEAAKIARCIEKHLLGLAFKTDADNCVLDPEEILPELASA